MVNLTISMLLMTSFRQHTGPDYLLVYVLRIVNLTVISLAHYETTARPEEILHVGSIINK